MVPNSLGGPTADLVVPSTTVAPTIKDAQHLRLAVKIQGITPLENGQGIEFFLKATVPVTGGVIVAAALPPLQPQTVRFSSIPAGGEMRARMRIPQPEDGNYGIAYSVRSDTLAAASAGGDPVVDATNGVVFLIYRGGRLTQIRKELPAARSDGWPDPEWQPGPLKPGLSTRLR